MIFRMSAKSDCTARMLLALLLIPVITSLTEAAELLPGDSTWSIRVEDLWSTGQHLGIYPTFAAGKWQRAIATSHEFSTSVHVVRTSKVKPVDGKFAAEIDVLFAPDPWMPEDGRPQELIIEVEGQFIGYSMKAGLSGT